MEVHTYIDDQETCQVYLIPLPNLERYLEKMRRCCPNTTIALVVNDKDLEEVEWTQ